MACTSQHPSGHTTPSPKHLPAATYTKIVYTTADAGVSNHQPQGTYHYEHLSPAASEMRLSLPRATSPLYGQYITVHYHSDNIYQEQIS